MPWHEWLLVGLIALAASLHRLAMDVGKMTDIHDCPDCGGTHYGSKECPIKTPQSQWVGRADR